MSENGSLGAHAPADSAAEWLLRRQAGDPVETLPEFRAWHDSDAAHAAAWHDALRVWDSFDEAPDLLMTGMRQAALTARPQRRIVPAAWWTLGAAAAAAAAVVLLMPGPLRPWSAPDDKPLTTLAFATAAARQDVVLPDGTHIALDSNTALTATLYPHRRDIRLNRGQAYFDVTHDDARPLTVGAMGGSVTDLGTRFNVLARPRGMQVLLIEGALAVADGEHRVQLAPGDSYDTSPGARAIEHPDAHALLAWRDGYLEFSGEPLGQAVAAMNRYAVHPITLADPAIARLPSLAGRFKTDDTLQFAQALADIYSLKLVHRPGGAIELRR